MGRAGRTRPWPVSRFGQLASPRLRQLDQRFDANQTSFVILEPDRSFLPMRHERIHALAEEHNVLAVFEDFAKQAHAPGSCVKSSAMARAWCGWASNQACVSLRTWRSEERRVGKEWGCGWWRYG